MEFSFDFVAEMVRPSGRLPVTVLMAICSWLPPESLIRFKYVCKSWYSFITDLINNPKFVTKHVHNAHNILSPKSFLILAEYYPRGPDHINIPYNLLLMNISSNDEEEDCILPGIEELDKWSPWGGGPHSEDKYSDLMGTELLLTTFCHCDGIICFIAFDNILLWNPALRESKILPPPINTYQADLDEDSFTAGFGCDPVANDYKIIRIWTHDKVDIYSLNTNTWRETKVDLNEGNWVNPGMELCYEGVCYWFLSGGDKNMMLSLDLHAEEFQIVTLPHPKTSVRTLHVWIDSIAYVSICELEGTRSIEMWVTKNCSGIITDSTNWIKYLSIVPTERIHAPLRFWKSDELLLEGGDGQFVSYNLDTEKFREFMIHGACGILLCDQPYVKSLISVNRRGQT